MSSFNKVILLGNLTRDPEIRFTPKGQAVGKLGLATNRKYKSDSGEAKEEVTFIDIDVWGKQAEVIGQYLKKGDPLFLEGRLKLDQWDDKTTGQKVSKLKVTMESFQFVGGKSDSGARTVPAGDVDRLVSGVARGRTSIPDPKSPAAVDDGDVPF